MKKNIKLLTLFFLLFLLTGCFGTNQVTKDAKDYLNNKYGMNSEDYKIKDNMLYDKNKECFMGCGDNFLQIIYNGNEQFVKYDPSNNVFSDTIQYNDIVSGFKEDFNKNYVKTTDINISINKYNNKYYDKNNLKDFNENLEIIAYFDDSSIYNEEETNKFLLDYYNKYGGLINIVYFKNKEDYDNYFLYNTSKKLNKIGWYDYYDRFIDFYVKIENGNIEKIVSNKINLGYGFVAAGWNLNNDINFKKVEMFDLNKIEQYDESKYIIESDCYEISSNNPDFNKESFKLLNEDLNAGKKTLAVKLVDKNGNIQYSLKDCLNEHFYFTKYINYKEMDFIVLKSK